MDKEFLVVTGIILLAVGLVVGIIIYHFTGEWIAVRARIVKKYERTVPIFIPVGKFLFQYFIITTTLLWIMVIQ